MKKGYAILGIVCLGAVARAQVLFDNTGTENGYTVRNPGDGPALQIMNTNGSDVHLTSVSFLGQTNLGQNFDFFLTDGSGNVLSQVFQAVGITGPNTLIGTNVNWTLAAGQTYYIGAMSDTVPAFYDYTFPGFHLENGLQSAANGNFLTYGAPTFAGNGSADMSWQLNGTTVPEPGAILALTVGMVGLVSRRRRK